MSSFDDWMTLPQAAERWGVTRARVWRLVSEEKLPESVVTRMGDRWMLSIDFVAAVEERLREMTGRYRVDKAIREVAQEEMVDG